MNGFGCRDMVGKIDWLLLKYPRDAFKDQISIDNKWQSAYWVGCPNYEAALAEYDQFAALLERLVVDLHYLPSNLDTGISSIYSHDPIISSNRGTILCNMANSSRQTEPQQTGRFLKQLGVPIQDQIHGEGLLEGEDVVWLDEHSVAVGIGYRSKAAGIAQLQALLGDFTVVPVQLTHWTGTADSLHLMSILSPIDQNLEVVHSRLMPVAFCRLLLSRGMQLIEVSDVEYETFACNELVVEHRKCMLLAGNQETYANLESAGVEVYTFADAEICLKRPGSPTCLTRPIARA